MNAKKLIRDIIIIVIFVVVAVFVLKSTRSGDAGPVESAHGDMAGHSMDGGMVNPHASHGPFLQLSDGDTIVSFGEHSIGSDWYDSTVMRYQAEFLSQGQSEDEALAGSMELALVDGLVELIFKMTSDEYGLEVDDAFLDAEEERFYTERNSREEARQILDEMGFTIDQVRAMWAETELQDRIFRKVAEINGVDPDSPDADVVFNSYLEEKLVMTDWVITDPEIEAVYLSYLDAVNVSEDMGDPYSEEMVDPHGEMESGDVSE